MTSNEEGELPLLSERDTRFLKLELADWPTVLGFDPANFGVDVGMGEVDGERIGLMSALVVAIRRHGLPLPTAKRQDLP